MSPRTLELGPLELQILGTLSQKENRSVSDVQSHLKKRGNALAYTTVMTVLTRLFQKGHLKRNKIGRQFLYSLAQEKEKVRYSFFDRVRTSLFQNDRLKPILNLLDSKEEFTLEELQELKQAVNQKLKEKKKDA